METLYYQDRLLLHKLRQQHPLWRLRDLAEAVGRSVSWVKKWLKRCTDRLLQHPKKSETSCPFLCHLEFPARQNSLANVSGRNSHDIRRDTMSPIS